MYTTYGAGGKYVGSQNDILYIIDQPPRPSNDDINPDHTTVAVAKVYDVHDMFVYTNLFAAAPDLLAACEALPLDMLDREDDLDAAEFKDNAGEFMRAMRKARAAIAKAKGDGR